MKRRRFEISEKNLSILKFLVKFNLYAIPLYIILFFDLSWPWLQQATANITYGLMNALGFGASINGYTIAIPVKNGTWAAVINWDCTGWKSMLAFFALVMSTSLPIGRKLCGLVLLPVIYLVNIIRITFMFFYVRTFDLAFYETVHAVIWSWGLIAVILALWIIWLKYDLRIPFRYSGSRLPAKHHTLGRRDFAQITRKKQIKRGKGK